MGVRIGFMVVGGILIVLSFWTYCTKKLTIDYAVTWSLLGIGLILIGAIPIFLEWVNTLGTAAERILFCMGALLLFAEIHESLAISQLTLKNRELAMQVALLNRENEVIKAELERLTNAQGETDAEKDLIRY